MVKEKQKSPKTTTEPSKTSFFNERMKIRAFIGFLTILVLALYGNTIFNHYNLDDYHVAQDNLTFKKGVHGIIESFSTAYAEESVGKYGYRPLIRGFYALEYSILSSVGLEDNHPYISHFVNIILYLIGVLFLYKVLRRMFKDYHPFFPFLVMVLFTAHPIHTEIVASLKNRDELLVLIFSTWILHNVFRYNDTRKIRYLYWSLPLIMLAILSKGTAAASTMLLVFSALFFTDIEPKKVVRLLIIFLLVGALFAIAPYIALGLDRNVFLVENPIGFVDNVFLKIAYGAYTLYYYLRLLIFPHPLLFYYGYNMVPVVNFTNIWVILSIFFHLGIFIWAIYTFRRKHILSYAILTYLGTIAMFTNVFFPAPGIIAERFMLFPSLAFSVALGWLLMKIFIRDTTVKQMKTIKLVFVSLIALLIIIPYSAKTITRNSQWETQYSLFRHDIKYLYNSVKANDLYANELMKIVNRELNKPVNVTKFMEPKIQEATKHWLRSVEIMPEYFSSWNNLGIIQSRIYKNYDSALYYFRKADFYNPNNPQTYFNLGQAFEGKQIYDSALSYYERSLALDTLAINTRSRLANLHYGLGNFRKAVELNYEINRIDPDESLPYVNIGNYHILQKDTLKAIGFYEKAVDKGAPSIVANFLARYYQSKGDTKKAEEYRQRAILQDNPN